MRFEEIHNIWSVDPKTLSNIDRGKLFLERAKVVVASVLADTSKGKAIQGTRLRRSYLASAIGCRPGALAENPSLRELVLWADRQIAGQSEKGQVNRPRLRTRIECLERTICELLSAVSAHGEEIERLRYQLQNWRGAGRPPSEAKIMRDTKRNGGA